MTYEGTKFFISRLGHNCLDKCLDETQDQDTFETKIKAVTLKTKTKTVKILSRNCLSLPKCTCLKVGANRLTMKALIKEEDFEFRVNLMRGDGK